MTIKYLKTTVGSGAINLDTVNGLLGNVTTFFQALTIANSTVSTNTTTGALVVTGGVGVGGNLNVGGQVVVNQSFRALSAEFIDNVLISGTLTTSSINNSGTITASGASLGVASATSLTVSGSGSFDNITVTNLASTGSLITPTGQITNLTATSINAADASLSNTLTAGTVATNNIVPNSGLQINFGTTDKIRITGGSTGQVLSTDGNGNLSWVDGPGALTAGTGLARVGNTLSLAVTGFAPGVYDRVTVDEYGRVVSATVVTDTLEVVTQRGASSTQVINLTNSTNSTSLTSGALVVTGGVAVGQTLTANQVVVKNTFTAEQYLYAQDFADFSKTVNFNGRDAGLAPIKVKPGSILPNPATGTIEFDGDYFYITTSFGRQIVSTRDPNAPTNPTALVRATATIDIDISSPSQSVSINGDEVDCWDDVILNAFDRVLLTEQDNAAENGVWVYRGSGQALIRAADFDNLTGIFTGTTIFVGEGTLNGGSTYQIDTANPIVVGTTEIVITQRTNKNNHAVNNLPKNTTSGLIARTEYGSAALRSIDSATSWITITNADAKNGNPTINTSTIPVTSGGTGRTNIIGWMRGTGTSIVSSQTIPLANIAGAGTMASQNANNVSITGGNITVTNSNATNTTTTNLNSENITATGQTTLNTVTANSLSIANLTVSGPISVPGLLGNAIALGANSTGSLNTAAVSVSTTQNVTDTIALMNVILGKLVPPPPPNFPNSQSLAVSSLTTARMANFTQTDNTSTQDRNVGGGTTIGAIRRSASYQTNVITGSGPGDTGTVSVIKNGSTAGSKTMVGGENGTYGDLVITNNQDYSLINPAVNANFWYSFDTYASGSVTQGWNEVKINHTASTATNVVYWYYDASSPGTPTFTNTMITMDVNVASYSSTIPHYTSSSRFELTFDINRLSGDTYPTSDNFVTGSAGGAFAQPASLSYSAAGITTPLARNLYVSAGSVNCTTTSNIVSGFGSSSVGPVLSVSNGYATGTHTFNPGVTVLYKTGTSNQIEETSIPVTGVGSGSGNAVRIVNPGSGDTPTYSANAASFDSQNSTLQTYDATVVGAVLKHDQTNYSSGHLPVGPNLSVGRNGSQYFTFKFVRSVVSKFDVSFTGTLAGIWVALPGSTIDTTSTLNGWLDMSIAYNGSGVPGAGAGGNNSNGCAVGGTVPLNTAQTNKRVTATFGTVSSSSTATNEIYVRVKLTAGQSLTSLRIEAASN